MADVVVANDPITGQGSNNASHCAQLYLEQIVARGERPFDRAWMSATFERYWDYARHVTRWTNAMLAPPPPHVLELIGAAGQFPEVAPGSPTASPTRRTTSTGSSTRTWRRSTCAASPPRSRRNAPGAWTDTLRALLPAGGCPRHWRQHVRAGRDSVIEIHHFTRPNRFARPVQVILTTM